ncbi:hypothetical protein [Mycolicibacterium psychrotolerans]|uniref:Glycosyltransferase RgtA/B/C/D-like domain-containing protein n=1 Tax=Mycolicibacterium psychrotolerans TaxID=216929 RepID=A0A7I7MFM8_9MYCO|nr:hypothetical protein [Mycolicibacterium psychrotolerans]BBX70978.1 hypothetical protein MPSYJ_44390 [Mycolicibacterium psychrotolerans]
MDVNEPQQSQLVLIPSRTASPKTSIFSARSMRSAIFDAALALAAAVVIYPWAIQFPGGLIRDDGFFYAQISYNIAAHGSSSFDLINSTDGYHQLWALILAGASSRLMSFTDVKSVHLVVYIAVNLYLILVTVRMLSLRRVAAFALFFLLLSCSLLMEGHLALLLCVVALRELERSVDRARPAMLMALALLPFSRIDATVVGLFLVGVAALSGRRRVATAMTAALMAGVAFHFTYLRVVHGSFFTVSSELKASSSEGPLGQLLTNIQWGAGSAGLPIPIGPNFAVFLLLAFMGVLLWLISPALRARKELVALWVGVLAFTLGHALFNTLRPWYFTLAYGVFGYTVLAGVSTLSIRWRRPLLAMVAAVMILPTAMLGLLGVQQHDEARDVRAFVDSLDEYVPEGAPIFMVDGSGYVGWSSNRQIVNGDGLVNSHSYAKRLVAGELDGYLRERGIRYFITNTRAADAPVLIDTGGLVVRRDDAVLMAEKRGGNRYFFTQLRLWELKVPQHIA